MIFGDRFKTRSLISHSAQQKHETLIPGSPQGAAEHNHHLPCSSLTDMSFFLFLQSFTISSPPLLFHLTLAISAFLYPSQSHRGPLLRWVTLTWTQQKRPSEARSICKILLLSALTAGAQAFPALTSECTSPAANHRTASREWRKISTSWTKLPGHQRTPHSQNSSITLARLVCLVNLVFRPYDNTVFGQRTAGTAQTSCSSVFCNNSPTDITLSLFPALSPVLKSLQLLRGSKPNVLLSVICPEGRGKIY